MNAGLLIRQKKKIMRFGKEKYSQTNSLRKVLFRIINYFISYQIPALEKQWSINVWSSSSTILIEASSHLEPLNKPGLITEPPLWFL